MEQLWLAETSKNVTGYGDDQHRRHAQYGIVGPDLHRQLIGMDALKNCESLKQQRKLERTVV